MVVFPIMWLVLILVFGNNGFYVIFDIINIIFSIIAVLFVLLDNRLISLAYGEYQQLPLSQWNKNGDQG